MLLKLCFVHRFLLLLFLCKCGYCIEPVTTLVGAGIFGLGGVLFKQGLVKSAFCSLGIVECCSSHWIKSDIAGLKRDLQKYVFGQHIALEIVPAAIFAQQSKLASKPLVMSFHGWPGGGKNYVSQFIVENFFTRGLESKFYHYYNGRTHFPLEREAKTYARQLINDVSKSVYQCPNSIFVFDEVDKMPAGIFDGIKPFLDHHVHVDGIDYRNAIFILLSNTGGNLITERYLELWRKNGKTREQMTLNDFDLVLSRGAFNQKGGLQLSDVIDHSLIDHYVPFLPLEREHIEMCIKDEFRKREVEISSKLVIEAMETVVFGPEREAIFSTSGCKRLSQKIAAIITREKWKKIV